MDFKPDTDYVVTTSMFVYTSTSTSSSKVYWQKDGTGLTWLDMKLLAAPAPPPPPKKEAKTLSRKELYQQDDDDDVCYPTEYCNLNHIDRSITMQAAVFLCLVTVYIYNITADIAGGVRGKVFNKNFMEQFDKEHEAAFGTKAPINGYPDCGAGPYSEKLEYKDWYIFNLRQRAHLDFHETLVPFIALVAVTAINRPMFAAILAAKYLFWRIMAGICTCAGGLKCRMCFVAIFIPICYIAAMVGAFYSLSMWKHTDWELMPNDAADVDAETKAR